MILYIYIMQSTTDLNSNISFSDAKLRLKSLECPTICI